MCKNKELMSAGPKTSLGNMRYTFVLIIVFWPLSSVKKISLS